MVLRCFKRIIAFILSIAMLIPLFCVSAYAVVPALPGGVLLGQAVKGVGGVGLGLVVGNFVSSLPELDDYLEGETHQVANKFHSLFNDDICPGRLEELNASHSFVKQHTQVDGDIGNYYICEYCGKSAGEVMDSAYDNYVGTLPASVYNSNGEYVYSNGWVLHEILHDGVDIKDDIATFDGKSTVKINTFGVDFIKNPHVVFRYYITPDVDMYLTVYRPPTLGYSFLNGNSGQYGNVILHDLFTDEQIYGVKSGGGTSTAIWPSASFKSLVYTLPAGGAFYLDINSLSPARVNFQDANTYLSVYFPEITAAPLTPPAVNPYTVDTRVSSLSGDFGILGDDGTIIKSDTEYIVNEDNSTVYNPVTNTTSNMTEWTYDYSDRSYNVTLDDGTTQTITYGDEYIMIQEGDTVYNIYYLTEGDDESETPVTPPGTCSHNYTGSITKDATCTASGSQTFTCSLCGDSYTQRIAATGHDWRIMHQVPTEYDETGALVTQGYTIYQCSVCSDQYKDEGGTGPPNSSTDTDNGGGLFSSLWELLSNVINTILTGIISFLETVLGQIVNIVTMIGELFGQIPSWFSGFTAFLAAVFPFFPEELITLLIFGITAMVLVALIRRFL